MEYDLFLKYGKSLALNVNDCYPGSLCDKIFADIIYEEDAVNEAEDDEDKGTKIGFVSWLHYNQALAMAYGLNMTDIRLLTFMINSKALLELDHTHITQETIDEIGAATNPNIMVLHHFGISAAWRNKGMGEQVLKGIIKQMKGKCGYIMILHSEPLQCRKNAGADSLYEVRGVELAGLEKDPEKAQWKLNAFFQRCGFRLFKNYDNVFVCNVDQVVAERKLVMRPMPRFT